jgi:hypothetical protein
MANQQSTNKATKSTSQKATAKGAAQPADRQPKSNGQADEEAVYRITYNGRQYSVGRRDLTDAEARLFRREMGCSLASCLADPDLDVFVALVWLIDRRDDPTVELDDYAGTLSYEDAEHLMG